MKLLSTAFVIAGLALPITTAVAQTTNTPATTTRTDTVRVEDSGSSGKWGWLGLLGLGGLYPLFRERRTVTPTTTTTRP